MPLPEVQEKKEQDSDSVCGTGQWSNAEWAGDVLLKTGVEKHQEFLPTSTCFCFVLKRFLVLENVSLTWWVGALLFLWKLVSCCEAKHLPSWMDQSLMSLCSACYCHLVTSMPLTAMDGSWTGSWWVLLHPPLLDWQPILTLSWMFLWNQNHLHFQEYWWCSGDKTFTQKGDSNSENITLVGEYIWGR